MAKITRSSALDGIPTKAPTPNRLPTKAATEIENLTDEEHVFYIEGVLAEGNVLVIVSQPATGKSYLAEMMAYVMAAGGNWFDKFVAPEPVNVLYLLTDGSEQDLKERAVGPVALGFGGLEPERLRFATEVPGLDLADPKGVKSSTFKVLSNEFNEGDFKVCIVDSMYSSIQGDISDAKVAQAFARMMAEFGQKHPDVAWIILHHSKKISTNSDGIPIKDPNPFLGSNYLNAMVDQMWEYELVGNDQAKLSQIKVRSNRLRWDPWFVEFDFETEVITPQGHKFSDRERAFKMWVQQLGRNFSKKEAIAWGEGQQVSERSVEGYLTGLRKENRIEDVGKGIYKYVPPATGKAAVRQLDTGA